MGFELPQNLYKLRRVDANSLSMLASHCLYLAPIESFNDPFEALFPWLNFNCSESEGVESRFQELDSQYRSSSHHTCLRVCALTERCDDIVSWGHYADCHKGFALQFNFRGDRISPLIFPVTYEADMPIFSPSPDSNEIARLGLLTKSVCWSYEKEWRLIGHVPESEPHRHMTIPYEPKSLTGVIFGLRLPHEHKMLIKKLLLNHPNVRFMQAHKSHNRFSLSIADAT